MLPRVQQVIRQTKARIFHGDSRSEGKIVSLFEPSAEVIRKGKASKPTEFGKLVKLQQRTRSSSIMRLLRNGPAIWTC
jgi:transposase, IS5 family